MQNSEELAKEMDALLKEAVRQAKALYPHSRTLTARRTFSRVIHEAVRESRKTHPGNTAQQMRYAREFANGFIRRELARLKGTMH